MAEHSTALEQPILVSAHAHAQDPRHLGAAVRRSAIAGHELAVQGLSIERHNYRPVAAIATGGSSSVTEITIYDGVRLPIMGPPWSSGTRRTRHALVSWV